MHIVAEYPIELRRVTFLDATPTDGPAMHTREALRSAACMTISTATDGTSLEQDPAGHASRGTSH
mgnify:CR=1 FL=1